MKATIWFMPAFLGAAALLVGCGGSQAPSAGSLPATNVGGAAFQPGPAGCQNGNLEIHPCRVTFNASNPGPTIVTLGREGNKLPITERDDCASAGIATVTKVKPEHWSVAAGSTAGSCTAHFTNGRGQGNGAKLKIVNEL
jgi:hypothetical protein